MSTATRNRVYWHGTFPDFAKQGRIVRRGTLRHEICWDGSDEVRLEWAEAVKPVGQHRTCRCGRCAT